VDLGGVRSKKVKVVQEGVVRAAKTNDDKTDEGGDSTYHGQSDTCRATHLDGMYQSCHDGLGRGLRS